MKKISFFICLFFGYTLLWAQTTDDNERRWLILLSQEEEHPQLEEQVDAIKANREGAIERKIGVIQVTIDGAKSVFNSQVNSINIAESFQNLLSEDSDFEAILMGLDGSIKLRRNRAIEIDELFDLIDSMPMRKQEIQRQKRAEKL